MASAATNMWANIAADICWRPQRPLARSAALVLAPIVFASTAFATDVLTQRYDNGRTGSIAQPGLNQAAVENAAWRELARLNVDGIVYAQPLYAENLQLPSSKERDLVFIATGANNLYAYDAESFQLVWTVNLGPNDKSAIGKPGCDGISLPGGIGVESTPVIDRDAGVLYVSYRTNPASTNLATAQQRLRAIDISDGHQIRDVQITAPNAAATWTQWHRSRAGLLLLNGIVYVGIASRCEDPGSPMFNGWILGYGADTLQQVGAFSPTATGTAATTVDGGGIWQGAVGLAADPQGSIYIATGNRRAGVDGLSPDAPTLTDSIIRLDPEITRNAAGSPTSAVLNVGSSFTPYRRVWMDDQDLDLASSGPIVLPGTRFVFGGGKSGTAYLLDGSKLGGFDTAHAWTAAVLNAIPLDALAAESPDDPAADQVVQKFQAAANFYVPLAATYLPHAATPSAAAPQGSDQLDVFAVGRDGALYVYSEAGNGPWTDGTSGRPGPDAVTPNKFAPPLAHVTVSAQNTDQLDAFLVGSDGAIYVTWEVGNGRWTDGGAGQAAPARATPPALAPPGAPLAVARQGSNQLDAFVAGNDGAVHVTWSAGGGHWADGLPGDATPAAVTPPGLAPPGASVAAAAQGSNQLDAFTVGRDGAIYVTWSVGGGPWTDGAPGHGSPGPITSIGFAPPGAPVAAATQGPNQLDVFAAGTDGAVYVISVAGEGRWATPVRITPAGLAPSGACVSAAQQNPQQLDVFFVGGDGAAYVTSVVGTGRWTDGLAGSPPPVRITPAGVAVPGTCVSAVKQNAGQLDAFVTAVNGALLVAYETNDGAWSDGLPGHAIPAQLGMAVWMRGCWQCWPHIHGAPVFAAFPGHESELYLWPEKDQLKAFLWQGSKIDSGHPVLAAYKNGAPVVAPPGPPFGMPGGMLAVAVDTDGNGGVLFASVPMPQGPQTQGILRAFDPFTLKELWNNGGIGAAYNFVKFVPPTIAGGKVYLPTASCAVIVYGSSSASGQAGGVSAPATPACPAVTAATEDAMATGLMIPTRPGAVVH